MMKQGRVRRLLVRAERARKHLMQPYSTRIGLTFGQSHICILDVLLARGYITQKGSSNLCYMDVITMSRSLNRLEEFGYLVRRKDPGYHRLYLTCLIGEGTVEAHKVHRVLEMVDDVIWKGLGWDKIEVFYDIVEKICENLGQCDFKWDNKT